MVQVPWDFALVSFMELLRLGIPVIIPARAPLSGTDSSWI